MSVANFFKKNWIHFVAVAVFLIICVIYFAPQLEGNAIKQHDIEQHIGSSHEVQDYREHHNGEEPLWTNSMFGGMPATQISVIYPGNWAAKTITGYFNLIGGPIGITLLYMLCFYVAMLLLKINRWVAIAGAIGFAFLSYDIIIVQAGHNSKAVAIAFLAPVIASFMVAYRRNILLGIVLSAVFMTLEMAANHLQITYYLGFLLVALGIVEIIRTVQSKRYKYFMKATGGLIAAYLLAFMINSPNIILTQEYAASTIRGGNELTIAPDGRSNKVDATNGLERSYITQYSLGIGETYTLISPYAFGGGSMAIADSPFADKVEGMDFSSDEMQTVMGSNAYWGDQPIVSGPAYIGVILVFLALIGMIYIRDKSKWAFLAATVLTVALSWGKNYMGLTDFFLNHVPGYDKFRAVTIILVIAELCIPFLAMYFLDQLVKHKDEIANNIRPFFIGTGAFVLFLVISMVSGVSKSYLSEQERSPDLFAKQEAAVRDQIKSMTPEQAQQSGIDKNNQAQINQIVDEQIGGMEAGFRKLEEARESIFTGSMLRSILFTLLAAGAIFLYLRTSLPAPAFVGIVGVLILIDLIGVTRNYLNSEMDDTGNYKYWDSSLSLKYPIFPDKGDSDILDFETQNKAVAAAVEAGRKEGKAVAMELDATSAESRKIENAYAFAALNRATDYRVWDMTGGFNSARTSYLHKSLGGYHGAKLQNIQNIYEFHLMNSNNRVLDMLNVKYVLQSDKQTGELVVNPNPSALGNAWFVKNVHIVPDANTEIRSLGARYHLQNAGTGTLLINEEPKKEADVYGSEKIQYLKPGASDTLRVPLANGIAEGMEVAFVEDARGNRDLVPAQTLQADTSNSFKTFVKYAITQDFNPGEEAVVRKDMASKLNTSAHGEGRINLVSYAPNKLVYDADAAKAGLAVFSEVYYPKGWKATINNKAADILRVDYILRGLNVPAGKSKIVFTYDLPEYHSLNNLSRIFSIVLLLLFLGGTWYALKGRGKQKSGEASATE